MTKESRIPSLDELNTRKNKLTVVIAQRKVLYDNVGSGQVKPDSTENIIRIGRVKSKVHASINSLESLLERTEQEIDYDSNPDKLIQSAASYLAERDRKRDDLNQIRAYVREGHLTSEVLNGPESEYRKLLDRRKDPSIAKGIQLLAERKHREIESSSLAILEINQNTMQVRIDLPEDKREVIFTDTGDFEVLKYLARSPGEEVGRSQLAEALRKRGFSNYRSVGHSVNGVRRVLETDPSNPTIVITSKKGSETFYRLRCESKLKRGSRNITYSGNKELQGSREIPESRRNALQRLLNDSGATLDDIIYELGPAVNGRRLTWPQAKFALKRAAGSMYRKKVIREATSEEIALWEEMKKKLGSESDMEAKEVISATIETWFRQKRTNASE